MTRSDRVLVALVGFLFVAMLFLVLYAGPVQ